MHQDCEVHVAEKDIFNYRISDFFYPGDAVTVQCKVRATDPLELYYQKLYSNWSYVNGVQPKDPRISVWTELDPEDPLNHNIHLRIEKTRYLYLLRFSISRDFAIYLKILSSVICYRLY